MCCSLWVNGQGPGPDHSENQQPGATLAGSLVSSLHRLKDIDNRGEESSVGSYTLQTLILTSDGGFFVFGDLSVKIVGDHKLHFSLFEMRK